MSLTVNVADIDFDSSIFKPMDLGHDALNEFVSNKGGALPATLTLLTGSPGAGKTTFVCECLNNVGKVEGQKTLLMSYEMTKIDVASLLSRFPQWQNIEMYFPDFDNNFYDDFLELVVEGGYDMIAIDSFKEMKELISDQQGWTGKKTERKLLTDLQEASEKEPYTAFLIIQQVLKSGDFAGSKRLQHMVTASLKMTVDGNESYLKYDKNRRGEAHMKLPYEIFESSIEFDAAAYRNQKEGADIEKKSKKTKSKNRLSSLDDLLGSSGSPQNQQTQSSDDDVSWNGEAAETMDDIDPEAFRMAYENENGRLNTVRKTVVEMGAVQPTSNKDGFCTWHKANKKAKELGLK